MWSRNVFYYKEGREKTIEKYGWFSGIVVKKGGGNGEENVSFWVIYTMGCIYIIFAILLFYDIHKDKGCDIFVLNV